MPFNALVQRRRCGGDLQRILDKLDYLRDLGINAIHLNPVFDSPSSHKYYGRSFHHIDPNFGPDPAAGERLEGTCELFPEQASKLGFREYDPRLGGNSAREPAAHIGLLERPLELIEVLPESVFRGDTWLDRRGMLSMLRTCLLHERDLRVWQTNPQIHSNAAIDSVFELLVRGAEKLSKVLPAIESRLAKLPDFLRAGNLCGHIFLRPCRMSRRWI